MQRKPVTAATPKRSTVSALQRTGTPARNPDSRSSTPVPNTNQTNSPSRSLSLSGIAKDSALTKQADVALNTLETTLQEHTDQLTTKIEQMSSRISALDDMIQDLLKDDFDDPDRSITPRQSEERRRFSGEHLDLTQEPVMAQPPSAEVTPLDVPGNIASAPGTGPTSARPRPPPRTGRSAGPTTPMFPLGMDTGTPLLSEQSPFFTDKWPARRRLED